MIRLKELRKMHNMTQEELGRLVGATKSSISLYESGKQEPNIEMIKRISEVLEATPDALIGYENATIQSTIQTSEARILAKGIDKLPKEQREQALNIMKAVFSQYADCFEEKNA